MGVLRVVGDGAEEALPIVDEAANALLHDVEGAGRRHDFGGTLLLEGRLVDVLAEVDRCLGEATQGQVCQRTSMKVKKQRKTVIRAMKRTWLLGITVSSSVM